MVGLSELERIFVSRVGVVVVVMVVIDLVVYCGWLPLLSASSCNGSGRTSAFPSMLVLLRLELRFRDEF